MLIKCEFMDERQSVVTWLAGRAPNVEILQKNLKDKRQLSYCMKP